MMKILLKIKKKYFLNYKINVFNSLIEFKKKIKALLITQCVQ